MSAAAMSEVSQTYGAIFVGLLFEAFLQGLVTVQTFTYFLNFADDPCWIKTLVATVWTMNTTHLCLVAHTVYSKLVTSWGNDSALLVVPQLFNGEFALVSVPTLLCQSFLLQRIWVLSRHNWLVTGTLALGCLAGFFLEVAVMVQVLLNAVVAEYQRVARQVISGAVLLAVVDLVLALTLLVYLRRNDITLGSDQSIHKPHRRTRIILQKIMKYTIATGLLTSILSFAILAAILLSPHSFIYVAVYLLYGPLYTNALLANLNLRAELRREVDRPLTTLATLSVVVAPPAPCIPHDVVPPHEDIVFLEPMKRYDSTDTAIVTV
ncbi:hypothetical protein MIND_01416700 [Mycena indigotica]|uniref:DUF6534 domain-containing protein n=1 Tax=Mycena indigotica TaxID=2126181 RepID=A0A8H6VUS3_9AGAR|nr:uncharacterized protein MIND_01416700 [Mycena indigotica]KAF7288999.1 hypothetical protein MIND_01416700 [Mycena indigotica]